jgi:hypothetical protein
LNKKKIKSFFEQVFVLKDGYVGEDGGVSFIVDWISGWR